jgi:4'-phosphopantetheinyl transferase
LRAGEVHVWTFTLDDETPDADVVLSPEERERAARFVHGRDRARYVRCHVQVRSILARYAGEPAHGLRIIARPDGKPFLDGRQLFFSLSRTAACGGLAIARDGDVGLDIEQRRDFDELDAMLRRLSTVQEVRDLERWSRDERVAAFFRRWTRAEAGAKASGAGIAVALASAPPCDTGCRRLLDLDLGDDLFGCVAVPASVGRVRYFRPDVH